MNHTSQDILKEVLSEYMEAEAVRVPPTKELKRKHTFSESFLEKMRSLIEADKSTAGETKSAVKPGFFRRVSQSRVFVRVVAACIVCVIAFGAARMIFRSTGGGSVSSDSSATDMAAIESEEMVTEDAAEESEAVSGDTYDSDQGETLYEAQAETDLAGLNVTVSSYSSHSMELELSNATGAEITYGGYYTIEEYDETSGTWEAAEQWYDGMFEDLDYIVRDGETVTLTLDWSALYGELSEGTWRLTKEVQSENGEGWYTLTVVFEL